MTSSRLSSDILEEQFGPTTIGILYQDNAIRIIKTITEQSGQVLELSLVHFLPVAAQAFPEVHQKILAGQSMGKAFRDVDIPFQREEQFACKHEVPPTIRALFAADQQATIVSVLIRAGDNSTPYARISEVYTGAALWPRLFGEMTPEAQADLNLLTEHLKTSTGNKQ